jgi:hypothetical protein
MTALKVEEMYKLKQKMKRMWNGPIPDNFSLINPHLSGNNA